MSKAQKLADELGRASMAQAIGVGPTAISNAVVKGEFPPSWYLAVSILCADAGIKCPPELFKMKSTIGVAHPNDVHLQQVTEGGDIRTSDVGGPAP